MYIPFQLHKDFGKMYNCLMEMPSKNLSVMQWYIYDVMKFPFAPTVDGVFLPRQPVQMLREGDFKNTELLIGSNLDEGKFNILSGMFNNFLTLLS
jgi:acetylcholinesterase